MHLESILRDLEGPGSRFNRDPDLYFVTIFGKPAATEAWGWRVEGHHLSVNFTIIKGTVVSGTPSFFGANPGEVQVGPRKGLRVLAEEEDLARAFVKSLDQAQRAIAIVNTTAPRDIITGAQRRVQPLAPPGLPASKLNQEQSNQLLELVKAYIYRHRPEIADLDLAKIQQAGLEKVHFAWAGGLERGEGHYYRVQGPSFLLEYDNTQNNNNHIHSVWRDFDNDFGEDLLRRHYQDTPHPQ